MRTAALATSVALLAVASADGGTITGALSAPVSSPSSPIDISSGTADWVYYGNNAVATQPDRKSGGPASFSDATITTDVGMVISTDSMTYLSFSGGTPTASATADQNFIFGHNAGGGVSFTHTLLAATEKLSVYLVTYNAMSDLTATLSTGGSYSATDVALPLTDGDGTGAGHSFGVLELTISGTVGETLTFSTTVNTAHGSGDPCSGIQASVAVPEPATGAISRDFH